MLPLGFRIQWIFDTEDVLLMRMRATDNLEKRQALLSHILYNRECIFKTQHREQQP